MDENEKLYSCGWALRRGPFSVLMSSKQERWGVRKNERI
jgi:hypothetical protein